jgi:hypothetical protein
VVNIFQWFSSRKTDGKNAPASGTVEGTEEGHAAADSAFSSPEAQDALKTAIQQTYTQLAFLSRDVNLPEDVAARYAEGLIFREPGATDASKRLGAPATTHRFGILSNHMKDLGAFDLQNRGLAVAAFDARFKVLARHEHKGKTLILLLHLPEENWQLLRHVRVDHFEESLIREAIEEFEKQCAMEIIPELADEEWLKRCAHPVGMDDEGRFFFPEEKDGNEESASLLVFVKMHEMAEMLEDFEDADWVLHSTMLLADWIWKNRENLSPDDLRLLLTIGGIILRNNPPSEKNRETA